MPYNTRRKSLSLPSLGIHIPVTNAVRAANRAAANSASASPTTNSKAMLSSTAKSMAPPPREDRHANKRLKRAHSESEDSEQEPHSAPLPKKRSHHAVKFDHTPPPSPPATDRSSVEMVDADDDAPKKIDMEGINDEIVEAVIVQLQNTGNRPHLVKELAAVLMQQLKIVQQ